ncbi:DUF4064 domain-containing protein [Staphylococcus americanisciuri]|uniref:DUF4064 domain-containing protein n=1 Tax=Staphylococcus americanisciuri TaxID=2973940 RepID=A0ABT2F2V0_9STAP|nr:DUF4064 domain-containing protein [Staphylococcus americanisciuri]MCS4486719.1 DUF4064 domain-containing protein [Staphylococcus americanisciuri]
MSDNYTYQSHQEPNMQQQPMKPFKRTGEKVLSWIGIVLHVIWGLLLIGAGTFLPKLAEQNYEIQQSLAEQGYDPNQLANGGAAIVMTAIMAVIPFILALIAVFLFHKNVLAGILLILAAVSGVFLSGSFLAGLLWFIAAIMLFVRKPKNTEYTIMTK